MPQPPDILAFASAIRSETRAHPIFEDLVAERRTAGGHGFRFRLSGGDRVWIVVAPLGAGRVIAVRAWRDGESRRELRFATSSLHCDDPVAITAAIARALA